MRRSSPAVRPLDAVTTELTEVVADLQRQLQDAQDAVRRQRSESAALEEAVRRRDAEIERLSKEAPGPFSVPRSGADAADASAGSSARVIQQLHDQARRPHAAHPHAPAHHSPSIAAGRFPHCRAASPRPRQLCGSSG